MTLRRSISMQASPSSRGDKGCVVGLSRNPVEPKGLYKPATARSALEPGPVNQPGPNAFLDPRPMNWWCFWTTAKNCDCKPYQNQGWPVDVHQTTTRWRLVAVLGVLVTCTPHPPYVSHLRLDPRDNRVWVLLLDIGYRSARTISVGRTRRSRTLALRFKVVGTTPNCDFRCVPRKPI